jgi:hypothetical protein
MHDSKKDKINDPAFFFEKLNALNTSGTSLDVMPEGFGEFGLTVTNPIPVCTILGTHFYLSKLKTANGEIITYKRRGSTGAQNIKAIIDVYEVFCTDQKIATLYICPYNKKNSNKAPKGFIISD